MAIMEIVANGLRENICRAKGGVETADQELDLRQLCDLALVGTAGLRDLLFAFGPALL